ncbi:MAG: 50S ribosomal protein L30 [Spirochaetales bacterium]|nr:50S ribosomal protein L30 [Leptospiraceae bacterium]MCP5480122.1 50S ribosomal protein L30 [Spirochaetales bacterium]MCP5485538.1 50S ribosomal protein L30 [Spirochaetales bacterium]
MAERKVIVTLERSAIGTKPAHRATVRALGLRKRGARREHVMTPAVAGMIKQVGYLLRVEEA